MWRDAAEGIPVTTTPAVSPLAVEDLEVHVPGAGGPGLEVDVPPPEPPARATTPFRARNASSSGNGTPLLWSNDTEQAVLSAMLLDHGPAAHKVVESLDETAFFAERHRLLFRSMRALVQRGSAVDPVTLRDELLRDGDLDRAGGIEYIAALIDVVPTAANVEHYANRLREYTDARALAALGRQLQEAGLDTAAARAAIERALHSSLGTAAAVAPVVHSLRELLEHPDAGRPPVAAIARLAWAGRVVGIAGPEGCGKTTLIGAGVARHSIGQQFLDGVTHEPGKVLWVNLEEHRADVVRRALRFGADPDRLFVQERLGEAPLAAILCAIRQFQPAVTVIDSINVLGSLCGVVDAGQAAQWLPILRQLERATRESGTAMIWIAQAKKADGSYRDSTAIGHSADVVLELPAPEAGSARRRVRVKKTRWDLAEFTVELTGDTFQLTAIGELSIDAKVFQYIVAHSGCSKRAIREGVGGTAGDVDTAIGRLVASGAIHNAGISSHHSYKATGGASAEEGDSELPF